MNRFIGLGGHLGAGKDAVADYLVEHHGFVKIGMSDTLNEAVRALDPLVETTYGLTRYSTVVSERGYVEAKKVPEVRRLLQAFGTEVGRKMFGEDFWVNQAAARIQALLDDGKDVALTGVRFPNEVDMANRFGETWYVRRPGFDGGSNGHASETSISSASFDALIRNEGTLDDLYELVDFALRNPVHTLDPFARAAPAAPYLIG